MLNYPTTYTLAELRAALIRHKYFTYRELARLLWLSPGMTQQQQAVIDAFPYGHRLRSKMMACGEIDDWNNPRYCGVPVCPRCFMKERGKQTKKAIRDVFDGVPNERLAFLTILLPVRPHLQCVRADIDTEKRRLINLVGRQRRKDIRWSDFQIMGAWEVDRMSWSDYASAGRNTKLALDDLEFPNAILSFQEDPTIWRPHLHAIVELGNLTRDEVANAIRGAEGHGGAYQVDLQAFDQQREVNRNIQNLIRYSMKFRVEHGFKNGDVFDFISHEKQEAAERHWWPAEDIRDYAEWLKGEDMAGFRSLRFMLRKPKANRGHPVQVAVAKEKPVAVDDDVIRDDIGADFPRDEDWMIGWEVDEDPRNNKSLLDTNWTVSPESGLPLSLSTVRTNSQAAENAVMLPL